MPTVKTFAEKNISTPDPRVKKLHDLHGIPTAIIAEILSNPGVSPHMDRVLRLSLGEALSEDGVYIDEQGNRVSALYLSLPKPLSDEVRKKIKFSIFEGTNPAFPGATFMGKCQIGKLTPIAMQNAFSAEETVSEQIGGYTRRVKERVLSFTGDELCSGEFMYFDQPVARRMWTLPKNRGGGDSWEEMNRLVKGDSNDFYNLGRILQIALNGWVHPSDDQLYDAGDYADLWSRGNREYLSIDADGGSICRTDNPANGRSVRPLDA